MERIKSILDGRVPLLFVGTLLFLILTTIGVYLFKEPVLAINHIELARNGKSFFGLPSNIKLPFTLYRGWDVVAIVLYSFLIFVPLKKRDGEYTNTLFSLPLGASVSVAVSTISIMITNNFITGVLACLICGIILTVITSFMTEKKFEIGFAIGFGITSGLILGFKNLFTIGLGIGLLCSILFTLIIMIVLLITYLIKPILMKRKATNAQAWNV